MTSPFAVKAFGTHPYLPHIRRCRLSLSIRRFQRALFLLTSPSLPHNSGSSLESKVVLLCKRECICICCTLSSHGFEWYDESTCPLCRSFLAHLFGFCLRRHVGKCSDALSENLPSVCTLKSDHHHHTSGVGVCVVGGQLRKICGFCHVQGFLFVTVRVAV